MGHPGGHGVPQAGAQTAVGAGIQPVARQVGVHEPPGVGHEVAAVADHHRISIQHLAQLAVHPGGNDGIGRGGQQVLFVCSGGIFRVAQLGYPLVAVARVARCGPVGQRPDHLNQIARHRRRRLGVSGHRLGAVGQVHHLGVTEPAEREAEVERSTGHDHQIGVGTQHPTSAAEEQLMVGGQAPPAQTVGEDREPLGFHPGPQLIPGTVPVHVGAHQQSRVTSGGHHVGHLGHCVRIGSRPHRHGLIGHGADALGEQHVHGVVHENRPPMGGHGRLHRPVGGGGQIVVTPRSKRPLGDRSQDGHMVELLKRSRPPAGFRRPPAQHHQRRTVEPGRGHRAHRVGHARAGSHRGHPRTAGQLGQRLGGEHRGLLVAHVVEHHIALLHRGVIQREDVAPRQGEELLHPKGSQCGQDLFAPMTRHLFSRHSPHRNIHGGAAGQ